MAPIPQTRRRPFLQHPAIAVGLVLFFAVVGVQYTVKVLDRERDTRSAFLRWRGQILDLHEGRNIWEAYVYPNPPIMALVLSPLMHLPPLAGALTWFYLKAAMALAAIWWVFRLVENHPPLSPPCQGGEGGVGFPAWGKALAIALSLRPMVGDLTHGNVNLFILFLLAGGLYAYCRGRDVLAGLVLALAIACKITPALFIPYFVWKRAGKTLAGCAAGLVLFFGLIPGLFLGMEKNLHYLTCWVDNMVMPYSRGEVWTDHNNQSLPAVAYRLLTHSPSFSTYADNFHLTPAEYHNLVELPREVMPWLIKGCMALFALAVIWSCRTPTNSPCPPLGKGEPWRGQWGLAAEFSLVILGMLLFSERTWKHHCVTLLLPFTVLAYYLSAYRPRRRGLVLAGLVAALLLMLTTGTGLSAQHNRLGELAQVYGAYVWAFGILAGVLVVLLRKEVVSAEHFQRDRAGHERHRPGAVIYHGRVRIDAEQGVGDGLQGNRAVSGVDVVVGVDLSGQPSTSLPVESIHPRGSS